MSLDRIISFFEARAAGVTPPATFGPSVAPIPYPDDFALLRSEAEDIVGRADVGFKPELTGPEHFWKTALELTDPGLNETGPQSFFTKQNEWFDRNALIGVLGMDPLNSSQFWDMGVSFTFPAFEPIWYFNRVRLIREINEHFPAADYLSDAAPAPTPAPLPSPAPFDAPMTVAVEYSFLGGSGNRYHKRFAYDLVKAQAEVFDVLRAELSEAERLSEKL